MRKLAALAAVMIFVGGAMNALIAGRRLQGKSTLALVLAASEHPSVVIFDVNAQYGRVPATANLAEVESALDAAETLIAFRPDPAAVDSQFSDLVFVLKKFSDWSLIVDEAHLLQGRGWMNPDLAWLIRQAPVRPGPDGVAIIQATHRVVDLHTDARALATDTFLFYASLPSDLDGIAAQYGEDVSAQVQKLPEYHLVHYWLAQGGRPKWAVWSDPAAWYLDIGRP